MSGFATINGVNKALGDGWVTANGVWRKLSTGYATKGGIWKKVTSSGMPLSDLPVGALVSTNVNGTAKNFIVVHQGNPSASLYDSSCDGTWLLMKDIYENRQWHNTYNNDYKASDIHAYLNGPFISLFDSELQSAIKQVKIPYVDGAGAYGVLRTGADGLSTKAFLLSCAEIGWTKPGNVTIHIAGACLSYFSNLTETNSKRIAYLNGTATNWWTRSPFQNNGLSGWLVNANGGPDYNGVNNAYGIRPALILPSNAVVNPEPNADGSYTLLA